MLLPLVQIFGDGCAQDGCSFLHDERPGHFVGEQHAEDVEGTASVVEAKVFLQHQLCDSRGGM